MVCINVLYICIMFVFLFLFVIKCFNVAYEIDVDMVDVVLVYSSFSTCFKLVCNEFQKTETKINLIIKLLFCKFSLCPFLTLFDL